jgi:hypothetical protein
LKSNWRPLPLHRDRQRSIADKASARETPVAETKTFRTVGKSGRYPLWRVSHPRIDGTAVRLVVWFPNDQSAVIAVLAADKAAMGDVFYDGLGVRADVAINRWLYRLDREEER